MGKRKCTKTEYMSSRPCWSVLRYIPYRHFETLVDPSAAENLNPEHVFKTADDVQSPPVSLYPSSDFSKMFHSKDSRREHASELEFLRNRHIVTLGSS